jgi:hypothetical protein
MVLAPAVVCAVLATVALIASWTAAGGVRLAGGIGSSALAASSMSVPTARTLLDYAEWTSPDARRHPRGWSQRHLEGSALGKVRAMEEVRPGQRQALPAALGFDAHPRYVTIGGPFRSRTKPVNGPASASVSRPRLRRRTAETSRPMLAGLKPQTSSLRSP